MFIDKLARYNNYFYRGDNIARAIYEKFLSWIGQGICINVFRCLISLYFTFSVSYVQYIVQIPFLLNI